MSRTDEMLGWRGHKARDRDGDKLGTVEEIYLDAESGHPQWAALKTGFFGSKLTFVPLEGARVQDDDVVLDWPENVVKEAPRIDADGELSPEEEDRLYDHYERYDTPEHHGGAGAEGDDDRNADEDPTAGRTATSGAGAGLLDPTAGESARGGADQRGMDPTAGESGRGGADQRGMDPTAGESSRGGSDQRGMDPTGGESSRGGADQRGMDPTGGESARSGADQGGMDPTGGTSAARRPRIKRFIEEELGPDGNPTRRSTRTEEVFE